MPCILFYVTFLAMTYFHRKEETQKHCRFLSLRRYVGLECRPEWGYKRNYPAKQGYFTSLEYNCFNVFLQQVLSAVTGDFHMLYRATLIKLSPCLFSPTPCVLQLILQGVQIKRCLLVGGRGKELWRPESSLFCSSVRQNVTYQWAFFVRITDFSGRFEVLYF